jgi:hypothetical protein
LQVDTRHRTLLLTTHNSFKLRAIAIIDFVSFGALQAIGHGVSRPKSSYFRSTPTNQRSSSPFPRAPPLQARGPPPSQPACSRRPPPSPLATLSAPRSHPSPITRALANHAHTRSRAPLAQIQMMTAVAPTTVPATPAKLVISIPIQGDEDFIKSSPASPTDVSALIDRLEKKASFSPEALAKKEERAKALADIEVDARRDRARRANERHQEGLARKLRLEAAAVARASEKMEHKSLARTAKQAELDAKRSASAERQKALFEAVREAREQRQLDLSNRLAVLSASEERAARMQAKRREALVAKWTSQVKHAATVAQAHKAAKSEAVASAKANLSARLEAAADRRQDKIQATVDAASEDIAKAEKVRARKLQEDKVEEEARRARLGRAMERALGRRDGRLESVQFKAAESNARVRSVVELVKEQAATKPGQLAHALAVKMQAADVAHSLALKQIEAAALAAAANAPKKAPVLIIIPAHGPATVASPALLGRVLAGPLATTGMPTGAVTRASAGKTYVEGYMAESRKTCALLRAPTTAPTRSLPPPGLLERLMFKPKLLLATAKARHLAASGRRASYMAFIVARAAFFGSVRLARAQGRKAARAEIIRSLCELRANRATLKAQAHLASVQSKAIRCNKRVQAASLQRSIARLSLLNNAIEAEQKRQAAELQRAVMLQSRAVTARAAARVERFVTRRRELRAACMAKGIAKEVKCFEASCLRHLHLSGVVASAKRAQRGTVHIHPVATSVVRKALASALVNVMKAGDVDAARAEALARAALVSEAAASAAAAKAEGKGVAAASQAAKAAAIKKVKASPKGSPKATPNASPTKKDAEGWAVDHEVRQKEDGVVPNLVMGVDVAEPVKHAAEPVKHAAEPAETVAEPTPAPTPPVAKPAAGGWFGSLFGARLPPPPPPPSPPPAAPHSDC